MEKMLAVVMCGGESRRMGTDKGLINLKGETWAQLTYNKLTALNIPVKVSVNKTQPQAYRRLFNPNDLVIDSLNIPGPLNGLLSTHARYNQYDLLILACDMIAMEANTLQLLLNTRQALPGFDFYAYHNNLFFEPLCAIYTSAGLANVNATLANGSLNNFSLQSILKQGNTKQLPVTNTGAFKNHNDKGL